MERCETGSGKNCYPDWKRAISGLRGANPPPVPGSPALIIVDMQSYFLEQEGPAYLGAEEIIPNVQRLLDAFSDLKFSIFATRNSSPEFDGPIEKWWGTRLEPDDRWARLDPRITYPANTVILNKHLYGTFSSTNIDARLKKAECDSIIVCGVMTHLCCETTAREGFQHGYDVYFMADANATSSHEIHRSTLVALAHGFAYVLDTEEMINLLEGGNG